MRALCFALLLPLFAGAVLSGCRSSRNAPEQEEDLCRSQPAVLVPWPQDQTLVEEERYRHLVRDLSQGIVEGLRDGLERTQKFNSVTHENSCAQGVRVEGRITSLIHHHRQFHVRVAGRVVDCASGALLHSFELNADEKEIVRIPEELAKGFTRQVSRRTACRPQSSAATAPIQPVQPHPPGAETMPPPPPPVP